MKAVDKLLGIDQTELKSLLHYDEHTGEFTALSPRLGKRPVGSKIGYLDGNGYRRIGVCGVYFAAHRLAFLYMTGNLPGDIVDHINGVKDDNRWCNLREATSSENNRNKKVSANNTTGIKGVSVGKNGKFKSYICLGTFNTAEEAKTAYDQAAIKLHGEFYRG